MKKKVLSLCLVAMLAITAVVGGTMAYFTDTDDATNEFTVGNVDIDLTEPNWDEVGSKEAVDAYFKAKQAEADRIAAEEAEKERLEREANPTTEELLKQIRDILSNK